MRMYWGKGSIAPCILNLRNRWRWVVFMPWLLYSWGERPQYPLERRLGGPQSPYECSGKEKKSLPVPEITTQFVQPVV
jgi:hypothetical protein